MKSVHASLHEMGVAAADIRFEFFGPAGSLTEPEAAPQR
jgi:ferredoxin-NADP reductase